MAGYSGTPLVKKLGVKPGARVALIGAPDGFPAALGPLPEGAEIHAKLPGAATFDVILYFAPDLSSLSRQFGRLAARLSLAGGLWIAWPKKTSGVATDLNENAIRSIGLAHGLVDNKVCAVDEVWSGLRFVVRVADRASRASKRG
jgi:hypothetical protein